MWLGVRKMLVLLFITFMIVIFGRLAIISFRVTWSLVRVIFTLVFLPLVFILALCGGLLKIAFPILLIVGIISLFTDKTTC